MRLEQPYLEAIEFQESFLKGNNILLNGVLFLVCAIVIFISILPNFVRCGHRQGPLTACKSNLKNLGTSLEMYSTDYNGRYPRSLDALVPIYIKELPVCPKAGYQTYRATFGRKAPGNFDGEYQNYYFYECTGQHHSEVGLPANFPRYDAVSGLMERP